MSDQTFKFDGGKRTFHDKTHEEIVAEFEKELGRRLLGVQNEQISRFEALRVGFDTGERVWVSGASSSALEAVLIYGANKYSPGSWVFVEPFRYFDAGLRHYLDYQLDEFLDQESGLPHLDHMKTNMFLLNTHPSNDFYKGLPRPGMSK